MDGKREYHKGIDLVGLDDKTVYAVEDGVARTAYQKDGAGNYAAVTMSDGRRVFYMHLGSFLIKNGKTVKKGEPIGIMGNTGKSYGAHTHLELRPAGNGADSLDICEFTGIPNKVGRYFYDMNEEEDMTQEKFNEMMENYLSSREKDAPSAWSEGARRFCEEKGIIKGDENGNKKYNMFVTREELAEIIRRVSKDINA
ncbi:MAG: peptidoglycan DD-metalloendopeptidase family protein [Clostridia bacterium]|nr:peptidoglycan DD-metalloendopeptidase family protein [Clostridia bacterium]